jgi:site-specific DNA-methyltransferase (adenine-specific)
MREFEAPKLYHGDCEKILPSIGFVDAVISDPPYAVSHARCDVNVNLALFWDLINAVKRSENAPVVLFCAQPFTTDLINSNRKSFKYCWYWVKNTKTNYANAHKMPMRRLEEIAVFYDKQPAYNQLNLRYDEALKKSAKRGKPDEIYAGDRKFVFENKLETTRKHSGYSNFNSNVIFFDKPNTTTEYFNHPFQKPVDLMEFLIKTYTNEGDIVLDPFMGSGSTGVACKAAGRRFVGIELDKFYFDAAKNRIDNF